MPETSPDLHAFHPRVRAGSAVDVAVDLQGVLNQKPNSSSTSNVNEHRRAVQMLRDRGVDAAERFLDSTSPEVVIRTCQWNDRQKNGGPGLLIWKLRQGGVPLEDEPTSPRDRLRDVFDRYVSRHPYGSRLCSHAALAARKWPFDKEDCTGSMLVAAASYPALEMECDGCGLVASLTPRAMMKEAMA